MLLTLCKNKLDQADIEFAVINGLVLEYALAGGANTCMDYVNARIENTSAIFVPAQSAPCIEKEK